jgi:hypothetical protein
MRRFDSKSTLSVWAKGCAAISERGNVAVGTVTSVALAGAATREVAARENALE